MDHVLVLWSSHLVEVVTETGLFGWIWWLVFLLFWWFFLGVEIWWSVWLVLAWMDGLGRFNILEAVDHKLLDVFMEGFLLV